MGSSVPGNSCNTCTPTTISGTQCPMRLSDLCVYYSGSNLLAPNITTGSNLDTVINNLATYIGANVAISPNSGNILTRVSNGLYTPPVSVSADTRSSFILTEPTNNTIFVDGAKLKSVNNGGPVTLYQVPLNFLSQSIEAVNKNGAMASASVTAVGPYDQVAVTNGDSTSYIQFTHVYKTSAIVSARLKIKVNSLGADPIIGLGFIGASQTGDTDYGTKYIYADLTNSIVWRFISARFTPPTSTTNITAGIGSTPFASNGDILEVEYTIDLIGGGEYFYLKNFTSGSFLEGRATNLEIYQIHNEFANPTIHLAAGTYTILDYSIESNVPKHPLIHIIGDSMGLGSNIVVSDSLPYKLATQLPYNIFESANGGNYIYGIQIGQTQDIIKSQPKVVLFMHYLQLLTADFESTSPNYSTYFPAWTAVLKSIVGSGAIPVLVLMPSWPIASDATVAAWWTFALAQASTYNALVLDLRSFTFTYDSTGFHYDGASNTTITTQLIKLLSTNNLL